MTKDPPGPPATLEVPGWATRRRTAIATGLLLVTLAALNVADIWLFSYDDATKLDLRLWGYSQTEVIHLFDSYGPGGRRAYAVGLVIDTIYPLTLLAATVLLSARAFGAARRWLRWWWVAPATFAVLDVIENAMFGVMLAAYPDVPDGLVTIAAPITRVKLISFGPTVVLIVLAAVILVYRVLRTRFRARLAD
jgi:hypothetical protein